MLLLAAAALTFQAPFAGGDATFAAAGKIEAGQGTVSFWWKPDTNAINRPSAAVFQLDPAQPIQPGDFSLRVYLYAGSLRFQMRDRNLRDLLGEASGVALSPDRELHIALTWSEATGAALYVNGGRRSAVLGPVYLRSNLGRFSFGSGAVTDVRIYSGPLDALGVIQLAKRQAPPQPLPERSPLPPAAGRYGWHAAANVPHGSRFRVRKIAINDARAVNRFWWKLVDGKRDTVWPAASPSAWKYRDEDRNYQISPVAEAFNVVRTTGDATASVSLGDGLTGPRPGGQELHYFDFKNPLLIDEITVEVNTGTLAEVACLRVEPLEEGPPPKAGIVRLPAAEDTAVRGVRIEMNTTVGAYYYFSVPDPDDETRQIIEFDVRANSPRVSLELEFTPYPLARGKTMRVNASSPPGQVIWLAANPQQSLAEHLERRRLELRDLLQSASAAEIPLAPWVEPAPPEGVPRWAWQQVKLVTRLKQLADWWIDFRQIHTGEFGNGPDADAALARILPLAARLDGKVERYRQATRRLFDWLLKTGSVEASRVAAWPAFELDPGSAVLAEVTMESARSGVGRPRALPSQASPPRNIEQAQAELWQWLEQRFEYMTTGEPQSLELDPAALETIRLGRERAVSWENTGGEIAAIVEEARDDRIRLRLFALSRAERRIMMRVWKLAHGEYELSVGAAPKARVTLKPQSLVELDVPPREIVQVELKLMERKMPVADMPDLALEAQEISSDLRGLLIPVHNIGAAAAGPFRVTVHSPDGELLAEAVYAGLPAPTDLRPKVLLARFAELRTAPGLRVTVRLDSGGEEPNDSNNAVVLPAAGKP